MQNGNLSWQERHETKAPSWPLVIRAPAQRTNAKARRANRRAFGESGRSINSRVGCGTGRSIDFRVLGTARGAAFDARVDAAPMRGASHVIVCVLVTC